MLTVEGAHGPRITALNAAALRIGASVGQRLVDARAASPELVNIAADPDGDRKLLERLTLWVQRWGPWSMMDGHDAILLDATGASHLLGGPLPLLRDIARQFAARGLEARPAMAATAGAAWALSHYGSEHGMADPDDPLLRLAHLPVAALRLESETIALLRRLGLKRIGDLHAVPRDSLARRFRDRRSPQSNPLIRLDQLLGRTPEPMIPVHRSDPPMVTRRLVEPIRHRSLLDQIIRDLADEMVRLLEARRLGTRRLELRAYRVDGDVLARILEMAGAVRDAAHIVRLFAAKLDDVEAGFGIDQVDMLSTWSEPLALAQGNLDQQPSTGTTLPQMLDRIAARLGSAAVQQPVAHGSHLPERAVRWIAADQPVPAWQQELRFYDRPLKLLEQAEPILVIYATPEGVPRQFRWRGNRHEIVRSQGPERLAPEWWRERSAARLRDYYRIESASGARYWIYRHGLIDDARGGAPEWFLHGFFA